MAEMVRAMFSVVIGTNFSSFGVAGSATAFEVILNDVIVRSCGSLSDWLIAQSLSQQPFWRSESFADLSCLQQECCGRLSPPRHPHTAAETCPAIRNIKKMAVSRLSIDPREIWSL